jgi:Domain of unknown function (DUF4365)
VPDSLLASTDQQDFFSEIYLSAIAAEAGFTISRANFDRDGVDLSIKAGGSMRPQIDCQLKATINLGDAANGNFKFPLKVRNYDLLRLETLVPRVLVVYSMPVAKSDWISIGGEELTLRKCAFWVSLQGHPETTNTNNITIDVPLSNTLNVSSMKVLMERARKGERI